MKFKSIRKFIFFCFIVPFTLSLFINISTAFATTINNNVINQSPINKPIDNMLNTYLPTAKDTNTPSPPLPTLSPSNIIELKDYENENNNNNSINTITPTDLADNNIIVKVYNKTLNIVADMTLHDYTICAVAGEMPATFELEALKAQAIAARTYTYSHLKSGLGHNGQAHVCTYYGCCQAYVSIDQMKKNWGNNFEEKYQKIKRAVEETDGLVMLYNNSPITVFYFSTSNGYTDACQDVFVKNLPYYKSVESPGEETAPNYYSFVKLKYDEFLNTLSSKLNINISKEELYNNTSITRTDGGRVSSINFNGNSVKGTKIRTAFGLRSADFHITFNDEFILIEVYGNGHGVGMSQLGANYMAQNNCDFKSIINHYYIGIEIANIVL